MKRLSLSTFFFVTFIFSAFSQNNVAKYTIKNIKVNSKYSDFGTSYFGPNRIYFASNKENISSSKLSFSTTYEAPNYDLFKGLVNSTGEIEYIEKVKNIENQFNISNVSFTPDLKQVYFTLNNVVNGKTKEDKDGNVNIKIFRADVKTDGSWTNVLSLPFNSDDYSCAHPSVSEDNKILFFSSDMPGTHGASDIFWTTIYENGTYGTPQNLGSNINSTSRESFPYVDKNMIYFSSDRMGTVGGMDIFMFKLDEIDVTPINLGAPINSNYDDLCFVINRQNKNGFFSSNRIGGKGQDDLYYFTQDTEFKECKQIISGQILGEKTKNPILNAVVSMFSHDNILLASLPVKENGTYQFELACRGNYRVEASAIDYEMSTKNINFSPQIFSQKVDLYLVPKTKPKEEIVEVAQVVEPKEKVKSMKVRNESVEQNQKEIIPSFPSIIRNNIEVLDLPIIYFEIDSNIITQDAERILLKAVDILRKYQNVSIEFACHTDSRASFSYNLHLSELRAKEVYNFLLEKGIDPSRMTARGYGEARPANHCIDGVQCTEKEHTLNRRAEFVITKK
jgi:outer membrane protein OmpA-like peptidoglycan-associated protein